MDRGAENYRRFLDGDDEGISEIVRDYKDCLILFLNTIVGNIYTAEELAEETFFRLIIKKPRYSGKSSFKSWLFAVGRNIAVDHIRRFSRTAPGLTEEMEASLKDESDLEAEYLKEERKKQIRAAIRKLPEDYGAVLWLVYFEGLSSEETATVMKKNSRQMRNLLYRAKQSLKSELEKEGFVYEEF
ncbi:MAG: RNA polymerase sigma factor [Clostridia bacterium]|nr:RNA polymerase sigma factor [Clostridia bacterium]